MATPTSADAAGVRLVLMTAPDGETAEKIARTLVDERLAACGNILPGVTSIYRWEGEVQRDAEVLVLLKTSAARCAAMFERAAELHPYDVPELLAVDVRDGHEPYLKWLLQSTELEP